MAGTRVADSVWSLPWIFLGPTFWTHILLLAAIARSPVRSVLAPFVAMPFAPFVASSTTAMDRHCNVLALPYPGQMTQVKSKNDQLCHARAGRPNLTEWTILVGELNTGHRQCVSSSTYTLKKHYLTVIYIYTLLVHLVHFLGPASQFAQRSFAPHIVQKTLQIHCIFSCFITKGSLSYLSSPCFSKNVLQSGVGIVH